MSYCKLIFIPEDETKWRNFWSWIDFYFDRSFVKMLQAIWYVSIQLHPVDQTNNRINLQMQKWK